MGTMEILDLEGKFRGYQDPATFTHRRFKTFRGWPLPALTTYLFCIVLR